MKEVHTDLQYDTAKVTLTTLEITHTLLVPCCMFLFFLFSGNFLVGNKQLSIVFDVVGYHKK